jgi:predicted  nucleic acid-binding Zn-ribbon protein
MKNYMGHFGELESPESILSRVSDIEVLMAENNLLIKDLNKEKAKIESDIASVNQAILGNESKISTLEKKARDAEKAASQIKARNPYLSMSW